MNIGIRQKERNEETEYEKLKHFKWENEGKGGPMGSWMGGRGTGGYRDISISLAQAKDDVRRDRIKDWGKRRGT